MSGGSWAADPVKPPNKTETTTLVIIVRMMVFSWASILSDSQHSGKFFLTRHGR